MMDNFTMQGQPLNNVAPNQQQLPMVQQQSQQQQHHQIQQPQQQQQQTFPGMFNGFLTSPLMFPNLTQNGSVPMFYDPAQIQNSILMMNGFQVPQQQQSTPIMNQLSHNSIVIPTHVQQYPSPVLFQPAPQTQPIQTQQPIQQLHQPVQLLQQQQQQVQSPVSPPQQIPHQQHSVVVSPQQIQPQQPQAVPAQQPSPQQPTPQSKPSQPQLNPVTTQKPKQEPKQEDETKIKIPKIKKISFEAKLNELKDSRGAINKVESVAAFIKLMDEEKAQKNRPLLLAALNVSNKTCQDKFVELNGVKVLVNWLKEASEKNKPKLLMQILNILSKLPMTVECLKTSEVGKIVKTLLKTHQSNEQLKTRMESLMRQWRRLAEKQKQDISAMPPVPKKSKEVKSESDSGIFSMISGTTIPKKSSQPAPASVKPKPAAATSDANINNNGNNRRTQPPKVDTTDKRVASSGAQQRPASSTPKSSPLKRKAEDSPSDDPAVKRARTSSPPTTSANTSSSSKKKRVRWSEQLEHIKLFEKEIPIDGPDAAVDSALQQQQLQQQPPQQQHSYNQDRLNEKMFFAQQREQKRKRLEAMNATIQWYHPSPLTGIAVIERGRESQEASARSVEHSKRQPVVYHHPQDIPSTPASPQRDISLNTTLLKNLVFALSANKQPTAAQTTSSNPPNINNFTTQQHHNQPQQNFAQMHPHGNMYHADGRNMVQPPYQQQPQQHQQPYFEQPLLQQRAAAYQNGAPVNIAAVTSASIKPSKSIRCKFFETKVGCRNGANCPFFHAGVDPMPVGGVKEFDPEIAKQLQQSRMAKQQHRNPSSNNNNNRSYR